MTRADHDALQVWVKCGHGFSETSSRFAICLGPVVTHRAVASRHQGKRSNLIPIDQRLAVDDVVLDSRRLSLDRYCWRDLLSHWSPQVNVDRWGLDADDERVVDTVSALIVCAPVLPPTRNRVDGNCTLIC